MEYKYPANHNENEPENMRISDCLITAMFLPREYDKLLKLKTGKVVKYLLLLLLLAAIIRYVIPVSGAIAGMGGIKNIVLKEVPDFSLKNGTFSLDKKIERNDETSGIYLLVDTGVERFTKEDVPAQVVEAVLVSKSNVLIYNSLAGLGGMTQEDTFDNYKGFTITNQTIADANGMIYLLLVIVFAILYVLFIVEYLFSALFYAVVMYFLTKTMLLELDFGTVYKIALFAKSVGVVVMAVTYCINSSLFIMAGSAFNMLLTVIIMNRALIEMKLKQDA